MDIFWCVAYIYLEYGVKMYSVIIPNYSVNLICVGILT